MRHASLVLAGLCLTGSTVLLAQARPAPSRPQEMTIIIEVEKVGHQSAHARLEADWSAANSRAGYAGQYLGIVRNTGTRELWWLSGFGSNEERARNAMDNSTPRLNAVAERFEALDAAHTDAVRTVIATLRPDLSSGEPADITKARMIEVTRWRIRSGHDAAFAEAAKRYFGIAARAGVQFQTAFYEVSAGEPAGTYIGLTAIQSAAHFDRAQADAAKVYAAFSAEDNTELTRFLREGVMSTETHRFQIDPNISVLPDAWIATDPGFWTPSWKKVARTGSR
ncbi:MAG: hypothetical protein IT361_13930 [Gemmatimonadaceae bacterium]|nr:hypothetical protein [Gemmatimonadaceae bacterium]